MHQTHPTHATGHGGAPSLGRLCALAIVLLPSMTWAAGPTGTATATTAPFGAQALPPSSLGLPASTLPGASPYSFTSGGYAFAPFGAGRLPFGTLPFGQAPNPFGVDASVGGSGTQDPGARQVEQVPAVLSGADAHPAVLRGFPDPVESASPSPGSSAGVASGDTVTTTNDVRPAAPAAPATAAASGVDGGAGADAAEPARATSSGPVSVAGAVDSIIAHMSASVDGAARFVIDEAHLVDVVAPMVALALLSGTFDQQAATREIEANTNLRGAHAKFVAQGLAAWTHQRREVLQGRADAAVAFASSSTSAPLPLPAPPASTTARATAANEPPALAAAAPQTARTPVQAAFTSTRPAPRAWLWFAVATCFAAAALVTPGFLRGRSRARPARVTQAARAVSRTARVGFAR